MQSGCHFPAVPLAIAITLVVIVFATRVEAADTAHGSLPIGKDGKPLNLDFETGTLKDWTPTGDAFKRQPVKGDTVASRRQDMRSGHQGACWVGTFENGGDHPQGTLTSIPFKVTEPFASFLVAGGSRPNTCVELVNAGTKEAFFKVSGSDSEILRPVVVELRNQLGKEIFIRVVDNESGGWGHINFDDFRFYAERPQFPNEVTKAEQSNEMPAMDTLKFSGLAPEEAAKQMTLPPGFKATLFAGEPDVRQPIAFAFDHRGRLWVAEAYTYPIRAEEGKGKDRILVFEDEDGDGKFDKRTVFTEGLNLVSGMEVGFGGVWLGAAPYLMFIPIADGDEPKPAGPPEILLDGWAYQDTHETLNTFTWGPDGWLYGCHGVFTHSKVGKPGTPDKDRTKLNAGVWRLHPVTKKFELFSEGTSNPWGVDFDEKGECIIEACVIPHLFHMVQAGRFTRQAGSHFNPYTYDDIKTVADHLHWAGNKGPHAGNSRSASAGGGHAHAGLLVYQGENWPEQYLGRIFMNNIHGACLNMDIPERQGSGFVGHHGPNPIEFNDVWSQIINLQTAPDGSVYMIDWYDKNQCHHNDPNGHDRSNGRIFRISYDGAQKPSNYPKELWTADDETLLKCQFLFGGNDKDNWHARHARRILQERAASGKLSVKVAQQVAKVSLALSKPLTENQSLRVLWAEHVTGGITDEQALNYLRKEGIEFQFLRGWTIQSVCQKRQVSPTLLKEFVRLAAVDPSPVVRLYLASALQRLPVQERWGVVEGLSRHGEDATDHNLPLMVWYAAEPLVAADFQRALTLAENAKLPNLLGFCVRRAVALEKPEAMAAVAQTLGRVSDDSRRLEILSALSLAFKGQRHAAMPAGWEPLEASLSKSSNPEVRAQVQSLSLTFGSANALAALKATLMDRTAEPAARKTAAESLLAARDPGLPPLLLKLLNDPDLQGSAVRGLASYDNPDTAQAILKLYPTLPDNHKHDALITLSSRLPYARQLLASVNSGGVSRKDLTAELVRQLRNYKDAELDAEIVKAWGVVRESAADKQKEIEHYKGIYKAGGSQPGDASRGRALFVKTCQQCHTLFDVGGKVGPDLTGSNRGDLDYLLQNILDPNAVIPNDYRAWNVETKDDRTISGILKQQDDKSITLVTANETIVLPRNEVQSLRESQLSMMPEGLLQTFNDQEVRDLLFYLRGPAQAPLPVGSEGRVAVSAALPGSAELFNGKDLSNWEGDMSLWKVEDGEIVGRTATGLKHNEFLKSKGTYKDFRLSLKIKLTPNRENSGIQFRSEHFGAFEMKGPQADAGAGWWGKLYEENGRALLWKEPGDAWVKTNDWNSYEVLAVGSKIRTTLNGHVCVDLDDPNISREGVFGLQAHAGGPLEVRFKNIKLELNPSPEVKPRGNESIHANFV